MIQIYLLLNSLLYLILSVWCLLKPTVTANSLGYSFLNNSGRVEYLTIYVGLEIGFSFFLALSAFYHNIQLGGLIFCVCLYAGAMIIRTGSSLFYGNVSKITYMVGGLEYLLGIWGAALLFKNLDPS